jgi:uncharacterized Rmd1/YagE family protein
MQMQTEFFKATDIVDGCAIFPGQQLDLRQFRHIKPLSSSPLTISVGDNGIAVLFRYGVVVLIGMQSSEMTQFMTDIQAMVREPFDKPEKESFQLFVDTDVPEGMEQDRICLHAFNLQRLQIVADVLAKSTVLSHYEANLTRHFDRIEPVAESIRRGNHHGSKSRELLQHIGDTLMIEAKMTGRLEVTEKPELIWDYPQYDRLYLRLEDEFELSERHDAIDRKLGLISKTAQTLLDLIHGERSLRVEWYIVILIIVDIVIASAEKFF